MKKKHLWNHRSLVRLGISIPQNVGKVKLWTPSKKKRGKFPVLLIPFACDASRSTPAAEKFRVCYAELETGRKPAVVKMEPIHELEFAKGCKKTALEKATRPKCDEFRPKKSWALKHASPSFIIWLRILGIKFWACYFFAKYWYFVGLLQGCNFHGLHTVHQSENGLKMHKKWISLRTFQHTPGTYPRPPTNSLWRNSFHLGVWGSLGYAPGVCWGSLRISWLLWRVRIRTQKSKKMRRKLLL